MSPLRSEGPCGPLLSRWRGTERPGRWRGRAFWGPLAVCLVAAAGGAEATTTDHAVPSAAMSVGATQLSKAQQLYRDLEYEKVLPIVAELLLRTDLSVEQELDVYLLDGSCRAVLRDEVGAAAAFGRLLAGRPNFDLDPSTPPKILNAFRAAKLEAQERSRLEWNQRRAELRSSISIGGAPLQESRGGEPIPLVIRVRDPRAVVKGVQFRYRRASDSSFSSLALSSDQLSLWRGTIPATWTANEGGAVMEFYIEALDSEGPLRTLGTLSDPKRIRLSAGSESALRFSLPPWTVYTAGSSTVALAGVAAGLTVAVDALRRDYEAQAQLSVTDPQPGPELKNQEQLGNSLALIANAALVTTALGAIATVVAALVTDWDGKSQGAD